MRPIFRSTFFALAMAATPALALAEDAFTLQQTDVFAGPSSEFPPVASLPPNTEVGVAGCLSDWSWCDVTFANDRGWVWAGDLGYPYQGQRLVIIDNGPRLHIAVVTFSINAYWDAHYRSRPFFRERDVFVSRVHIEGGHGGKPPHGGTRVAQPSGGVQPGPGATAQGAQPAPSAQGQVQGGAQAQGGQQQPRREQGAQTEQRSREQAQTEQRSREQAQRPQPSSPQATERARPQEDAAKSPQRPQPEASRPQGDQRAQSQDERASSRGMTQQQPGQREGRDTAQSATRPEAMHPEPDRGASAKGPQNEASRGEPDRGASAKGPQNEASRGQPDRGASAKGPQGERPKEEGRESNQQ